MARGTERVIEIIMKRDEVGRLEAKELVDDTIEEIREALEEGRDFEVEDILADNLGLEMDYIFDLLEDLE